MTYAFTFDASACSGCKACQAACKDKNNLPTGVLWRRVMEVAGGGWQKDGEAWRNSVLAYNLSISCNHCIHPKCAGVCPTNAYQIRGDGLVILDTTKCIGCGYCGWACPYGAPQYNPSSGTMTKCDFCLDQLQQGLSPACVAACPLRVLGSTDCSIAPGLLLWQTPPQAHPYPLPAYSRTQPRLAIRPHPAMYSVEKKSVANVEEIQPRVPSLWEELPLVLYTLFTQLAVGSFWVMAWIFTPLWLLMQYEATRLQLLPSLLIGASLGAGMLASFAHLGTKKNAWRVLSNVAKSSLSREILFTLLFGLSWLLVTLQILIRHWSAVPWIAVTSIFGVGLIHNMSRVYRLPAAPGWNTWRTNATFMVSTLLLGLSAMTAVLAYESGFSGIQIPAGQWVVLNGWLIFLLLVPLAWMSRKARQHPLGLVRMELLIGGSLLSALALFNPAMQPLWMRILLFGIVACEETVGRWLFYQSRLEA